MICSPYIPPQGKQPIRWLVIIYTFLQNFNNRSLRAFKRRFLRQSGLKKNWESHIECKLSKWRIVA